MVFVNFSVVFGEHAFRMQMGEAKLSVARLRALLNLAAPRGVLIPDTAAITCSGIVVDSDEQVAMVFKAARGGSLMELQVTDGPAPPASSPAAGCGSSSDSGDPLTWSQTLNFYVNGSPVTVDNPDPRLHLVDFLRDHLMLKATKIGCYEGGCGACTVVMSFVNSAGKTVYEPINSCLRPLAACDGFHIITAEGIGSRATGYHPVQKALAENNGSQCGFCTVGWSMKGYAMLAEDSSPEAWKVDNSFDGNLCRCTGMFPILNAMKTFAPSDTLPAPPPSCGAGAAADASRKVASCTGVTTTTPGAVPPPVPLPAALKAYMSPPLRFTRTVAGTTLQWFSPATYVDLQNLQAQFKSAAPNMVKYVAGNTAFGVEKYFNGTPQLSPQPYTVFIDVTRVAELSAVSFDDTAGLTVGASVSLGDLIDLCGAHDPAAPTYTNDPSAPTSGTAPSSLACLSAHLLRVATRQVRSVGSWAGNLMMATHHHDFPSDVVLTLAGLGATMNILQAGVLQKGVPVDQVYKQSQSNVPTTLIVNMTVPFLKAPAYVVDSFKVMLRHQNTHALCNLAFSAAMSSGNISGASLVVGGATKGVYRCTATQAALNGQPWTQATLTAALAALATDLAAAGDSGYYGTTAAYRQQTAANLLFKLFVRAAPSSSVASTVASAGSRYIRPVSSEAATYVEASTTGAVGKAVPKLEAYEQAAGEAEYTFDVPMAGGLNGALAITTVSSGTITAIDVTAAAAAAGVAAVLMAKDITGANDIGYAPGSEKMFLEVGDDIAFFGQSVAVVLADTFQHALAASRLVAVAATAAATPPLFTIADAKAAGSFWPNNLPGRAVPGGTIVKGDAATAIAGAKHSTSGTFNAGGQKHLYMEVQNANCRRVDSDRLEMVVSTQAPFVALNGASHVTGLPDSKVTVKCRRTGGAFGGKLSRMLPVAAASALGAYVTGRQVHVQLERVQDMRMTGGREAMYAEWSVGYDDDGVIDGIQITMYTNGGGLYDAIGSGGDMDLALGSVDNTYYLGANVTITGHICKTNLPSTTSMRAPGVTQSTLLMEHIIVRIAAALGKDVNDVRTANFLRVGDTTPMGTPIKSITLPTVWSEALDNAGFTTKQTAVAAFNAANRWRKQGIAAVPIKYPISYFGYNAQIDLRIYFDGTVQATTSGCEMGQGLYTKLAQMVSYKFGIPLASVSVVPTNTDATPLVTFTGGSATSELCVSAAGIAADTLLTRLQPLRAKNPSYTWEQLIGAATADGIDLTAEADADPITPDVYMVYCAAVCTVEVDVLTGVVELQDAVCVYDAGTSLNPLLDVGQIEGAFVQGIGEYLTELLAFDDKGVQLSNGTFEYKPPFPLDIPTSMKTTLLANTPNPAGIMGSKATAEPAYSLAQCALHAVHHAVASARSDAGLSGEFDLPPPATPCVIASACGTTNDMLKLSP